LIVLLILFLLVIFLLNLTLLWRLVVPILRLSTSDWQFDKRFAHKRKRKMESKIRKKTKSRSRVTVRSSPSLTATLAFVRAPIDQGPPDKIVPRTPAGDFDREGSALRVRFFKNSIHIQTWRALSTTQGKEIISGVD
jgi:hypothetical protein